MRTQQPTQINHVVTFVHSSATPKANLEGFLTPCEKSLMSCPWLHFLLNHPETSHLHFPTKLDQTLRKGENLFLFFHTSSFHFA